MGERIHSPNTHHVSESTGVPNCRFCSSLLEFPAVHHISHFVNGDSGSINPRRAENTYPVCIFFDGFILGL